LKVKTMANAGQGPIEVRVMPCQNQLRDRQMLYGKPDKSSASPCTHLIWMSFQTRPAGEAAALYDKQRARYYSQELLSLAESHYYRIVETPGGDVLGIVGILSGKGTAGHGIVEVADLVVSASSRRRGIGSFLLAKGLLDIHAAGAQEFHAHVPAAAVSIFLNLGFQEIGTDQVSVRFGTVRSFTLSMSTAHADRLLQFVPSYLQP
jgi:N-acetylglutamate synthase-like GNAT family acetyltransferase